MKVEFFIYFFGESVRKKMKSILKVILKKTSMW